VTEPLQLWTVYDHPRDFPRGFIARRYDVFPAGPVRTGHVVAGPSLEELREVLTGMGLARLQTRSPDDDPGIVEVWI